MISCRKLLPAVLASLILSCSVPASAQTDTSSAVKKKFTLQAFAETYFTYGADLVVKEKPWFMSNHKIQNKPRFNLVFMKSNYTSEKFRANLAVMTGDYSYYNLQHEPVILRSLVEANVGLRLAPVLWLDAGVLPSHIGFESPVGKDCWTLTRSIVAENTPYYESGARLTWSARKNLEASLLYLNGWQRIIPHPGRHIPSGGVQLKYTLSNKTVLNYSGFAGSADADTLNRSRHYHQFYMIFQPFGKLSVTAGIDYGIQQMTKNADFTGTVLAPLLLVRYPFTSRLKAAARIEHYSDKYGMIISNPSGSGFRVNSFSLNLDYEPIRNALLRIEGRLMQSDERLFHYMNTFSKEQYFFTAAFLFWLG